MSTADERMMLALDAAYLHGLKPSIMVDEYSEVVEILGREPTQDEALLLGEMRSEGFRKRSQASLMRFAGGIHNLFAGDYLGV